MNDYYNAPRRDTGSVMLRKMFFDFFRKDPSFVLRTFFVFKPIRILRYALYFYESTIAIDPAWEAAVIPADMDPATFPQVNVMPPVWRAVILLGTLLSIAWIAAKDDEALGFLSTLSGMAAFFAVLAWLPNWLVALNPLVMIDNFLWTLLTVGLLFTLGCVFSIRKIRRI